MARHEQARTDELFGISIYQDPKKGAIFYDFFTKRAFIITQRDMRRYSTYSTSFMFAVIIAFVATTLLKLGFAATLLLALLACAAVMVYYRLTFFYKLPEVEGWKPPVRSDIITVLAEKYESGRLLLLFALLALLAFMMPFYGMGNGMTGIDLVANILVTAATVILALIILIAFFKKKRLNS